MNRPLISVIVPTYNDGPTLEKCVRSLFDQTWSNLEVIVVNDCSSDDTLAVLQKLAHEFPRLRYDSTELRSGAARARNTAFSMAEGEIIALIDGDMWAPPDWLEQLALPIVSGHVEVTGGPDFVPPTAPLASRCIGYSMDSILTNGGLRRGDTKLVTYLPGTGNMAIRADFIERSGHFDEEFHDTGEDKEWLHRVKEAGARFQYLPDALAWHERRPDILLHAKKQLLSGRRRFDIWEKDPSSFEWPHLAPSLLILFLVTAWFWAASRPLWYGVVLLGGSLVFADCYKGAKELGTPRAFLLLVLTSCAIPFGYGLGILQRAAERIKDKFLGLEA
jgi:glycosyltransferase involved in cell wall biosynthesis